MFQREKVHMSTKIVHNMRGAEDVLMLLLQPQAKINHSLRMYIQLFHIEKEKFTAIKQN